MNYFLIISIDGVVTKVPQAEALVLETLSELGTANGAEIARVSEKISAAAVYSLLGRLKKRNLVTRSESWEETDSGIPVRRVVYQVSSKVEILKSAVAPGSNTGTERVSDSRLEPHPG